jgi:hypothetical protein
LFRSRSYGRADESGSALPCDIGGGARPHLGLLSCNCRRLSCSPCVAAWGVAPGKRREPVRDRRGTAVACVVSPGLGGHANRVWKSCYASIVNEKNRLASPGIVFIDMHAGYGYKKLARDDPAVLATVHWTGGAPLGPPPSPDPEGSCFIFARTGADACNHDRPRLSFQDGGRRCYY